MGETKATEKFTVETTSKKEFKGMMSTTIMEYMELAGLVNEFFKQIFKDYDGCRPIETDGQRMPVIISFVPRSDNGVGAISAVEEIAKVEAKNGNTVSNYVNTILSKSLNGGESFRLTDAAKDIISKYIITLPGQNGVDWRTITNQTVVANYMNSSIEYRVANIDLNLLMEDIFDNEGKDFKYDVHVMRNAMAGINAHNSRMIEIAKADPAVVREFNAKYFTTATTVADDFIIR